MIKQDLYNRKTLEVTTFYNQILCYIDLLYLYFILNFFNIMYSSSVPRCITTVTPKVDVFFLVFFTTWCCFTDFYKKMKFIGKGSWMLKCEGLDFSCRLRCSQFQVFDCELKGRKYYWDWH